MKKLSVLFAILMGYMAPSQNFSTDGNGLRNSVVGQVKGKSVLYFSDLDGAVSAYTSEGKKLWRNESDVPAVMFEINAADVNNDGNDDLLAASGNGHIYCWDSSGKLLWKFNPGHKVRFSEIAVVKQKGLKIFAGGNDYNLYELNAKGEQVSVTKNQGVVRKIESGNFIESGVPSLFVMTYSHDKFRWEFFGFMDPISKEVIKALPINKVPLKDMSKMMMTDFDISDINKDGKDDILIFGDVSFKPLFIGLDGNFDVLAKFVATKKDIQRYGNSKGQSLLPAKDEIAFQFGSVFYSCDLKGNLIFSKGERYDNRVFSDFVVDAKNKTFYAVGELGGGNGVYGYHVGTKEWFHQPKLQGRFVEVQNNLETLYNQVLNFKLPEYQKKSDEEWVMITSKKVSPKLNKLDGGTIKFVIQHSPKESTDRSHLVKLMGDVALKKDKRGKYQDSREAIVLMAKKHEADGQPFTFWAGHGNDPFYIQIETLEQILEVAPTTCYGFIYAEMDNVEDSRVIHFVNEYLPRLAKAIRKNNKAKLYFRYKNMFWAATSHLPLWKSMFFSGKYNDILIPASEDTSNRTQDLNLAGRVGMFAGGYVDDFAMRLIDDNPTSWRPLSPGGQTTVSPYLRQGVEMAAYGARYGIVADNKFIEEPGLNILFALMKSGVLPVVDKADIRSIGSWHLIKDVDEKLVHAVDDHHNLKQYKLDDENAVFSVAQMHWAGTDVPEHDFSNLALGVTYRWLNYMPELPHGMVPIAPIETEALLNKNKVPYSVSDGKQGYVNNKKVSAVDFKSTLEAALLSGEKSLPVLVEGASWSAIKIDENHIRLILIDPGYLDPQNRDVTMIFQGNTPIEIVDILSQEKIEANGKSVKVGVPAGSMRFIDIAY